MDNDEAQRAKAVDDLAQVIPTDSAAYMMSKLPTVDWNLLATKADLEPFATKADLERFATRADLEAGLANCATKLELAELRADMRVGFESVRTEFADVRTEFADVCTGIADVRTEFAKAIGRQTWKMVGFTGVWGAALIAAAKYLP